MKRININNGTGPDCTPQEALAIVGLDVLVNYMDDVVRESVHDDICPCSDADFLAEYLKRATDDLIIG